MIVLNRADKLLPIYINVINVSALVPDPDDDTTWIYMNDGSKWNVMEKTNWVAEQIAVEMGTRVYDRT